VLAKKGCIDCNILMTLRKCFSPLQGHPCASLLPNIEVSTGSLGQGLSVSNGIALGLRLNNSSARVYCLLGDGEIQEGQVWEAAMSAGHYKIDNLCAIIDYNKLQIDGFVDDIMRISPIADKWRAFGWHVISIDGHSHEQILSALNEAEYTKGKPTLIIADTIKGKGISFYENKVQYHGVSPSEQELLLAIEELRA
jgi:transketolase